MATSPTDPLQQLESTITRLLGKYQKVVGYQTLLPVLDVLQDTLGRFRANAKHIYKISTAQDIIKNPRHRKHQLNMHHAINSYMPHLLEPVNELLDELMAHNHFRYPKEYVPQLVAFNNKLIFLNSFVNTTDESSYLPTTLQLIEDIHQEYISSQKVPSEYAQEIEIGGNVSSNLATFYSILGVANAFVGSSYEEENTIKRGLLTIFSSIYYFFRPERTAQKAMLLTTQPDLRYCQTLWDLPDTPLLKMATPVLLPSIKTNFEFNVETTDGHFVGARLLSPFKHKLMPAIRQPVATKEQLDLKNMEWTYNSLPLTPVVLHFHGGGFMAMSSASHQTYTRRWANQTNYPVVSVDYRKAPEYPYPAPHYDCYTFYKWLLDYSHALGFRVQKIILVGDSAGGNLVVSTCLRAISEGIRIPDGIVAVYPALMLSKSFSPSRLLALDDPLVSAQFLDICMTSVIPPNVDPSTDYFLSPLMAPRRLLEQFPPTYISVGKKDPLYDDSQYFARRLAAIKVHRPGRSSRPILQQMRIYREVGHAYLNLVDAVPELEKPITDVGNWLMALGQSEAQSAAQSPLPEQSYQIQSPSPSETYVKYQ